MRTKKYILAAVAATSLMLGASSCSDSFLDEHPQSSYLPNDPASIESYLQGLHYIYGQLWGTSGQQGFISCWQIGTDVASAGATQGVEVPFYQYAELNSENAGVDIFWKKSYSIINNANMIIKFEGEDGDKAAIGEAKFFRAYMYNQLVTLYGGVPLKTDPTEAETGAGTAFTRADVATVDALILSDLRYAATNLPEDGKTESRANKYMALQALGEVLLRIGQRTNETAYYKAAEDTLSAVINAGGGTRFALITERYGDTKVAGDYYSDMFKWGKQRRSQGNTEAIWTYEMEYNRNVVGGTIDNPQHRRIWVPSFHKRDGMINADSLGGRGNGRLRLSNWVKYNLYEEGDIRNSRYNIRRELYYNKPGWSSTIGIDKDGWQVDLKLKDESDNPAVVERRAVKTGSRFVPYSTDSIEVFSPYTMKWGCYDEKDDFGYACVKDWPVMRLGETYLLRAEARFREGNAQGAAEDINVLRDRAFKAYRLESGNANAGKVSSGEITMDFILDERARELVAEENRRMTLVRTGTLLERAKLNTDAARPITNLKAFNQLLPIPLTERQLNKDAKLDQNPEYVDAE